MQLSVRHKLHRKLSNAHAKQFRYASADPSIATVNSKGVVKGKKTGTTTIYVYARNGYAKEIKVTIRIKNNIKNKV